MKKTPVRSLRITVLLALVLAAAALTAVGCKSDPYQDALDDRRLWTVELRSWTQSEETGQLILDTRVYGPPSSSVDTLTFRWEVYDDSEKVIQENWETLDLSEVPRGGPKDIIFKLDAPAGTAGVSADMMLYPTDDQKAKIPELQKL